MATILSLHPPLYLISRLLVAEYYSRRLCCVYCCGRDMQCSMHYRNCSISRSLMGWPFPSPVMRSSASGDNWWAMLTGSPQLYTVSYSIGIVDTSCLFVGGGRPEKLPQRALPYKSKIGCNKANFLAIHSVRKDMYIHVSIVCGTVLHVYTHTVLICNLNSSSTTEKSFIIEILIKEIGKLAQLLNSKMGVQSNFHTMLYA